jgi:predicted AlkP superfamily pyrophosphatase or phosphodiesterase
MANRNLPLINVIIVSRRVLAAAAMVSALALVGSGCATAHHPSFQALAPGTLAVPANQAWTSTGIRLEHGHKLLVEEVEDAPPVLIKDDTWQRVGARGTYLFDVEDKPYPLEPDRLHNDRRYPGYCLIGRIGDSGTPFFVGSNFQGIAPDSGPLWLGINDPAPQHNTGEFRVRIAVHYPEPPLPVPPKTEVQTQAAAKHPPDAPGSPPPPLPVAKPSEPPRGVPDANVVIIFVDGLRPDVVTEMAEWGHMPYFNDLFMENGVWVRNSFTVQPSLTLTSFASMITGDYSNRHGVKMQAYYDRRADEYINGLSTRYFPRFAAEVKARQVNAIYDYFPDSFAAAAMPFEPLRPNILQMNLTEWLHRAVNEAGYVSNIKDKMDEVQTRFAVDLASSPKVKVMLVWLPSNDVASEHTPHGQFGGARSTIARMDADLGKIVERLKNRHRFEKTYFILVSDHGHSGGHEVVNKRFDVKREVFHAYLQMNVMSMWQRFNFPGAPIGRLGAVSDCDGAVGIFLPFGHVDSGDLSTPTTYNELSRYGLADGSHVDAVELFAEFSAAGRWPQDDLRRRPVDFAVTSVDPDTVLLYQTAERQALIHSRRNAAGVFEFRYEPVRHYAGDGALKPITTGDPLGYLDNEDFKKEVGDVAWWMENYHTGPEWLQATVKTNYPASVDTLNLYFRWDGPTNDQSPRPPQPDILLFANRGWVFEPKDNLASRSELELGSRHGMAFREATNNSLFVSGPGIKKGTVIETPHRIVDIMPTVLEMMGRDTASAGMDGHPMREIWEEKP